MEAVLIGAYVAIAVALVAVLGRVVSTVCAILRPTRRPRRVRRDHDRRRRHQLVAVDRRRAPRRQDDVARTFLAEIDRSRPGAARNHPT